MSADPPTSTTLSPDHEAARELSSAGSVVPVVHTYVEDAETPVSALSLTTG